MTEQEKGTHRVADRTHHASDYRSIRQPGSASRNSATADAETRLQPYTSRLHRLFSRASGFRSALRRDVKLRSSTRSCVRPPITSSPSHRLRGKVRAVRLGEQAV